MVKVFAILLDNSPTPGGFPQGSRVTGKAVVEVDEAKSYKHIEVSLAGSGNVEWTEGSGEDSETHRAKKEYFRETGTVWSGGGDDSATSALPAGRHEFPFAFSLPDTCPPSWELVSSSPTHVAWIRYAVTARICTRGALKADHTVEERVRVVGETTRADEDESDPARREASGSDGWLCCAVGQLALSAELPRSGFCAGDTIPLTVEAENGGSRDRTAAVTLIEKVRLKVRSHVTRPPPRTVVRVNTSPFRAGSTSTWSSELPPVPDGPITMETPGGMITVYYEVRVRMGLQFRQRLEVSFPVIVAHSRTSSHSDSTGDSVRVISDTMKMIPTDSYQPWNT